MSLYTEFLWVLPFILLLTCIAVFPLVSKHWWEKNFPWVCLGFSLVIVFRYLFQLHDAPSLLRSLSDYFSFICLVGSLFVVAGGIHIRVKGGATPAANCLFLFAGALLANVLGTTGASMVLVRPWLRMNKDRVRAYHVVFFIFIVSNIGGALTPVGDPPLFLGYLEGVPFFWPLRNLFFIWSLTIGALLAVFFVWDILNCRKDPEEVLRKETAHEEWKIEGGLNFFFLAAILAAVFLRRPPFLSEGIMLAAAFLSYVTTSKTLHRQNEFNFGPIREVAILFAGIFVTLVPALAWLEKYASQIGLSGAGQFYWGSGVLSSVLDSAPAYLDFLSAARGLFRTGPGPAGVGVLLQNHPAYVLAISVGTVLFGAVTYIGNGPNLLVKAVAERSGVKTPHFFEYCFRYSFPVLLPLFAALWYFFFRLPS